MSEEEILGNVNWAIHVNAITKTINGDHTSINVNVLKGLLDLYNKEKHKIICAKDRIEYYLLDNMELEKNPNRLKQELERLMKILEDER